MMLFGNNAFLCGAVEVFGKVLENTPHHSPPVESSHFGNWPAELVVNKRKYSYTQCNAKYTFGYFIANSNIIFTFVARCGARKSSGRIDYTFFLCMDFFRSTKYVHFYCHDQPCPKDFDESHQTLEKRDAKPYFSNCYDLGSAMKL